MFLIWFFYPGGKQLCLVAMFRRMGIGGRVRLGLQSSENCIVDRFLFVSLRWPDSKSEEGPAKQEKYFQRSPKKNWHKKTVAQISCVWHDGHLLLSCFLLESMSLGLDSQEMLAGIAINRWDWGSQDLLSMAFGENPQRLRKQQQSKIVWVQDFVRR